MKKKTDWMRSNRTLLEICILNLTAAKVVDSPRWHIKINTHMNAARTAVRCNLQSRVHEKNIMNFKHNLVISDDAQKAKVHLEQLQQLHWTMVKTHRKKKTMQEETVHFSFIFYAIDSNDKVFVKKRWTKPEVDFIKFATSMFFFCCFMS